MNDLSALRKEWQSMVVWLSHLPKESRCPFPLPKLDEVARDLELTPITDEMFESSSPEIPDIEPSVENLNESVLLALQGALSDDPIDVRVRSWSVKLLHSCEISRHKLKNRLINEQEAVDDGRRKILLLCLFFLAYFQYYKDARYINIVLKLLDLKWIRGSIGNLAWSHSDSASQWQNANIVLVHAILEHSLLALSHKLPTDNVILPELHGLESAPDLPMCNVFNENHSPGVVVFSPSIYSLYTISVLHLLKIHGVKVEAIVVRRMFNRKRIIHEFSRDGVRLLRKAWSKLVLRERVKTKREYQTLSQFLLTMNVTQKSIVEWGNDNDTPLHYCYTLNDQNVLDVLHSAQADAVVFTGGGLIREPVLKASGAGVINTHMGLLPPYRGMDVVEWPIFEGHTDKVGLTVHFMSKGLDEGDILSMHYAPRESTKNIVQLRERMAELIPKASVSATIRFLQGDLQRKPQVIEDGKLYFIMHPRLHAIAQGRYQEFRSTEV